MNFPYEEEHYKRREELFSNPEFTKEHRVVVAKPDLSLSDDPKQISAKYDLFITLKKDGILSQDDVNLCFMMMDDGLIDLSCDLEINWLHETVSVAAGKSTFTCEDVEDIHRILCQKDETLGMEVEDEIWRRHREYGEESDPEITIREATACFKFEMPSNDQVEAA